MSRAGSVDSAAAALASAFSDVVAPPATVKLRDGDLAIWCALMRARARSEWSSIDLHHAANLTRCLADIERMSVEIAQDGDTLTNERGTRVANPKHALLEVLSRRAVALTKLLQIHAYALTGDADKTVPLRKAEEAAREARQELRETVDDDDLLATPSRLQ